MLGINAFAINFLGMCIDLNDHTKVTNTVCQLLSYYPSYRSSSSISLLDGEHFLSALPIYIIITAYSYHNTSIVYRFVQIDITISSAVFQLHRIWLTYHIDPLYQQMTSPQQNKT